jgi:hypothetical protein
MKNEHRYLTGEKGLVVGIANDESIAYGCALRFNELGAVQAITYQNEKSKRFVEPVAENFAPEIFMPLDVQESEQMDAQLRRPFGPGREKIAPEAPRDRRGRRCCGGISCERPCGIINWEYHLY